MAFTRGLLLLFQTVQNTRPSSRLRVKECYQIARCFSGETKIIKTTESPEQHDVMDLDPFAPVKAPQKQFLDELTPPLKRSFNLAAYVNQSKTLQQLVKLGVSLYDIENTNNKAAKYYPNLDFETDCVPYIKFLIDNGLKERLLGKFISEFPLIFMEPLDDLQTRLNYLESKNFTPKMIAKALNNSSHIISHPTKELDQKLGKLQVEFRLPAEILRSIVVKYPFVIAIPSGQYKLVDFTLSEEFGFTTEEMHMILKAQPMIIEMERPSLIDRLDLIHNTIGLSHYQITRFPKLITGPQIDITHRANYLKKLKRDQFDSAKPLYVPPSALYNLSDEEFCAKVAKTNLEDYKLFLRAC